MNAIDYKDAQETKVFRFDYNNNIEEVSLYEHIMDSIEECTSPRGVEPRLHVRFDDETNKYGLYLWSRNYKLESVGEFDTEEEALQERFMRTYEYDFLPDDQRNIAYFDTEEEAKEFAEE